MKTAIKKIIGKASINLQTLPTIVIEVEAMMKIDLLPTFPLLEMIQCLLLLHTYYMDADRQLYQFTILW